LQIADLNAVTDRINAGAEIASVEPSLIEHTWQAISSIPREQRQNTGIDLHAVAHGDPDLLPQDPAQRVAMMMRYALLDALVERGILDEFMNDESLRKKVFAAAALFPCDKNDLGEALAQQLALNSPPDVAQKTSEDFRQAGYDPDHPKVSGKFIDWMRDNF
jgi:hypothetical protein